MHIKQPFCGYRQKCLHILQLLVIALLLMSPRRKRRMGEATSSSSPSPSRLVSKEMAAVEGTQTGDYRIVIMIVTDWMVTNIFVIIMYMRRIIHQRNSFNNYHRMIGGMEDEYWAQRQREWDVWKAEENDIWERQRRTSSIHTCTGRCQ